MSRTLPGASLMSTKLPGSGALVKSFPRRSLVQPNDPDPYNINQPIAANIPEAKINVPHSRSDTQITSMNATSTDTSTTQMLNKLGIAEHLYREFR